MGVGETLDTTFSIYRSRFSTLVMVVAVVLVPIGVISAIINSASIDNLDDVAASGVASFTLAALVVATLSWLAQLLATGAVVRAVAGEYLGEPVDWRDSLAGARKHLVSLCGATILIAIGVALGLFLFVAPGLFFLVSWALTVPAIVVEDLPATRGISRSWQLVGGRRWPILGVFVLVYLVIFGVSAIVQIVVVQLMFQTASAGTVFWSSMVTLATELVTVPLLTIAITIVYFDQRVRNEGFDIEVLASQIASMGAPPSAPRPQSEPGDQWPPAGS